MRSLFRSLPDEVLALVILGIFLALLYRFVLRPLRSPVPAALVLGLAFLFAGERLFGDETSFRVVLDGIGLGGIVASLVLRGRRTPTEAPLTPEIRQWISFIHVGIVVSLLLYVLQLPAPLAKLGFTGDMGKAAKAVLGTLWPIVLLISTLTALFLDAALISCRHMPILESLRIRASAQAGAVLGLLVSIFAVGNYVVSAHGLEKDLSRRKVGRPSEATMEVVKNLETPIVLNVFFPPSNEVELEIDSYLRSLESGSAGKILVHHWDHALDPKMAKRVSARDNGAIYLTKTSLEEGAAEADPPAVVNEKLQLGLKADSAKSTLKKFDAELQKRILKLARGSRRIYFTSGHGERNGKGSSGVDKEDGRGKLALLNRYLATQSYEVKLISAADGLANDVPADAALVVIAGATEPLLDGEIEALQRYFDRGGSLMILLENGQPNGVPEKLLAHLGVSYDPRLVANERIYVVEAKQISDKVLLATNKTTSHPSVTTLSRNKEQLFLAVPRTGTVAKADGTKANVQLVISSMPGGFRDINGNFLKDADENVAADKLTLVAAIEGEKKEGGKAGKAIVTGSAELADDKWLRVDGNIVFFSDSMKWMVGDEKLQAPVALSDEDIPIKHTTKENTIWFYATIFLAPAMVLAGGLGWVGRTRRRGPEPREGGGPGAKPLETKGGL